MVETLKKYCSGCNEYRFLPDEFHKCIANKDGYANRCKTCVSICGRVYRKIAGNKDAKKQYQKQYNKTIRGYLIRAFSHMKLRCSDTNRHNYYRYGGRGIKCKFVSPSIFVDYVTEVLKVDPRGFEIDRIDNNGHYEIGNIRFVTRLENARNKNLEIYSKGN